MRRALSGVDELSRTSVVLASGNGDVDMAFGATCLQFKRRLPESCPRSVFSSDPKYRCRIRTGQVDENCTWDLTSDSHFRPAVAVPVIPDSTVLVSQVRANGTVIPDLPSLLPGLERSCISQQSFVSGSLFKADTIKVVVRKR